ncbi:prenyltransferase [Marinobacter sp.]|uniref:prenyltransferase n=1 Tax=Marinobacter sp. TaxID=50741 RepID=UPI00384F7CDB
MDDPRGSENTVGGGKSGIAGNPSVSGRPGMDMDALFGLIRAPFLLLAPVCVALGWAAADLAGAPVQPLALLLVLLGALSAHVAVNALNEHDDFQSGLDFHTRRTAFSGGSGTLPARPELAPWAKRIGLGALLVTVVSGLLLIPKAGYGLVPLGVLGIIIIYTYTRWLNRRPWLCLIAPGFGFGVLFVIGTHLVLRGQVDAIALGVSLIPFLLVNNLLLLNQLPDVEADRKADRVTFPIAYGVAPTIILYLISGLLAYVWIILGWMLGWWPAGTLIALSGLPLMLAVAWGVHAHAPNIERYLGMNVVVVLGTPLLFLAGIIA